MKKYLLLVFLFCIIEISFTQETNDNIIITDDLESIFNTEFNDIDTDDPGNSVTDTMGMTRLTFNIAYNFFAGFSPGFSEAPWYDGEKEYTYILGVIMESLISFDFQLSKNLRVWNAFYFSIPSTSSNFITLKEFYFDYDLNKYIFIRGGQDTVAWGISPFFPFTNLPSRIPNEISGGDSYILKIDIPIGLGGMQILGMTRYGFMENKTSPQLNEIAWGLKYNLALQEADIDCGFFYFEKMPLRFFLSLKTTLGKTEFYTEGLVSVNYDDWSDLVFSGNMGLVTDFFNGMLTLGGEVFFNGEKGAYWYRAKEDIRDAETNLLFERWNGALNVILRPGVLNMRLFCQGLYAHTTQSYHLTPGISVKPRNQFNVSLMVPMALGSRDENSYYHNNFDTENRPFSIILTVTLNGNFRYRIYMDRSAN